LGLAWRAQRDGYGLPFDRPLFDFAERLLELNRRLPELLDLPLTGDEPDRQPIFKLALEVAIVAEDSALCQAVEELRWRCLVFDRLRTAMRIACSMVAMASTMTAQPRPCPPSAKVWRSFAENSRRIPNWQPTF
jgi:hypothetical protein